MAMIYQARELANRRGYWRYVGMSDESPGIVDECCDCEGGHPSPEEATDCPIATAKADRIFHMDAESLKARAARLRRQLADTEAELAGKAPSNGPAGEAGQVGWMGGEFDR